MSATTEEWPPIDGRVVTWTGRSASDPQRPPDQRHLERKAAVGDEPLSDRIVPRVESHLDVAREDEHEQHGSEEATSQPVTRRRHGRGAYELGQTARRHPRSRRPRKGPRDQIFEEPWRHEVRHAGDREQAGQAESGKRRLGGGCNSMCCRGASPYATRSIKRVSTSVAVRDAIAATAGGEEPSAVHTGSTVGAGVLCTNSTAAATMAPTSAAKVAVASVLQPIST